MILHKLARVLGMLVGWLELVLLTLPCYLLAFLPATVLAPWYHRLFRVWSRVFVHALGVDLRLHQKQRKPIPGQFILIANHPSAFEDIGIPALFDVRSLAKIEVRDWWVVGRISAAAGTLYVERASRESRRAAVQQIVDALEKGWNLALYPEGGCKGRRIQESFRYGAFEASLRTGVPILPVFLHYESQEDFAWPDRVPLVRKIWDIMATRNNRANYYLYDAIDPEGFSDAASYADQVHRMFAGWQQRYLD